MHWGTAPIRVPEKPLLTAVEVAALFEVHAKTIRRWVKEGKFPPPAKIGEQEKWTNMAVGVWLAWQDYVPAAGLKEEEAENGDEK